MSLDGIILKVNFITLSLSDPKFKNGIGVYLKILLDHLCNPHLERGHYEFYD
jgi:hypothetical protein